MMNVLSEVMKAAYSGWRCCLSASVGVIVTADVIPNVCLTISWSCFAMVFDLGSFALSVSCLPN